MKKKEIKAIQHLDVAIIGGGPAGLATSLALIDSGRKIVLIERSQYDQVRVGEHLTPNAVPHMIRLGILKLVKEGGHMSCSGVQSAWGGPDLIDQDYILNPYGDGLNLTRPAFDIALANETEQRGTILLKGTRVNKPEKLAGGWYLSTFGPEGRLDFNAKVLVDATGRTAWLARKLGSKIIALDNLVGLVGFMTPKSTVAFNDNRLLIESCEDGWWYLSPLANGSQVATYMTDSDFVSGTTIRSTILWNEKLNAAPHIVARTSAFEILQDVHVRPAQSQTLSAVTGFNWLAVGDAALSFDPLSSAGISKGLEWGIRAADTINRLLVDGQKGSLNCYQQQIALAFDQYRQVRARYYRMETRWSGAPFWQRRNGIFGDV